MYLRQIWKSRACCSELESVIELGNKPLVGCLEVGGDEQHWHETRLSRSRQSFEEKRGAPERDDGERGLDLALVFAVIG